MSTDLAPKPEPAPPSADAWVRSGDELNDHFKARGRITQAEIDRLEAEFFAKGGEIQAIPTGVSGEDSSQFNNRTVAILGPSQFSTAEQIAHAAELTKKAYAADADLIALVKEHLPDAKSIKGLCQACSCHADKLDRILRTYFADDARAKPFRRVSSEEREAHIVKQYPAIAGTMGLRQAAATLHVSMNELKRIIALYRLKPAPTTAQVWNNPNRPATREAAEAAA